MPRSLQYENLWRKRKRNLSGPLNQGSEGSGPGPEPGNAGVI